MAEKLLDLAQVGARVEELGGEHVPEGVRGDALPFVHAARLDVVAEDLAELSDLETPALHANEERLLDERLADLVVVDDQRYERGVDPDRPLPAALRLPHPQQSAQEVDVVPVEAEELAAAKTCVGKEREQQPVPLGRKKSFSASVVPAWLEAAGRVFCSLARKARRWVTLTSPSSSVPSACR